ncbi:hypothetical protein IWX92DRAFT_20592 [Phyllosticta citricarpa]
MSEARNLRGLHRLLTRLYLDDRHGLAVHVGIQQLPCTYPAEHLPNTPAKCVSKDTTSAAAQANSQSKKLTLGSTHHRKRREQTGISQLCHDADQRSRPLHPAAPRQTRQAARLRHVLDRKQLPRVQRNNILQRAPLATRTRSRRRRAAAGLGRQNRRYGPAIRGPACRQPLPPRLLPPRHQAAGVRAASHAGPRAARAETASRGSGEGAAGRGARSAGQGAGGKVSCAKGGETGWKVGEQTR